MLSKMNILFICSANIQRSKTAEDYFSEKYPDYNFDSAGTNAKICHKEGANLVDNEMLQWADTIYVMESKHRKKVLEIARGKPFDKIVVLHIPDKYVTLFIWINLRERFFR
ncbi:MAG: putative protein tyrosine phosphatase [Saprospiraceae bacterium]|jgi:predicted protein tyrosine phosphatase